MKKFLSLILASCLCFNLIFVSSAAQAVTDEDDAGSYCGDILLQEEGKIDESTDLSDSLTELFPQKENEELEKIILLAEKAVTSIYDYATRPEEPAVDLATVITIVRIAVTVIYAMIQSYG